MVDRRLAASSLFWSAAENGGLVVISLGCLVLFARLLTPAEFGVYSIAWSTVELLGVLVSMFFHDALVQRPDLTEMHIDSAFTATMALSVVLLLATLFCSDPIARAVGQPSLGPIVQWLSLSIPCTGLGAIIAAYQRRDFGFRMLALRSLLARGSSGLVGVALAVLGAGFWSLVAQQVTMALFGSLVLWATASRRPRLRFRMAEFRDLFSFGLCSISALFLRFATRRIFVVVAGLGLGTTEAGYMNLAFRSVDMFGGVAFGAVTQVALPILSRIQSDTVRLRRTFHSSVELASLALVPCFVGLAATAPLWVELGFGVQWLPSVPSTVIQGGLYLLSTPTIFAAPLLVAVGRPRDTLVVALAEIAVLSAVVGLVPLASATEAMAAWALIEVLVLLITAVLLWRASGLGVADQIAGALPAIVAAVAMGAVIWFGEASLPTAWPLVLRLVVLILLGAAVFTGWIAVINRRLAAEVFRMIASTVVRQPRSA